MTLNIYRIKTGELELSITGHPWIVFTAVNSFHSLHLPSYKWYVDIPLSYKLTEGR